MNLDRLSHDDVLNIRHHKNHMEHGGWHLFLPPDKTKPELIYLHVYPPSAARMIEKGLYLEIQKHDLIQMAREILRELDPKTDDLILQKLEQIRNLIDMQTE